MLDKLYMSFNVVLGSYPLIINWNNVQHIKNTARQEHALKYACLLPLFDKTNVIPTNANIGTIYAINPNTPNKNADNASPMNPPVPKCEIIAKMHIAKETNMVISSRIKLCFCVLCVLFAFVFTFRFDCVFFLFLVDAMSIPLVS